MHSPKPFRDTRNYAQTESIEKQNYIVYKKQRAANMYYIVDKSKQYLKGSGQRWQCKKKIEKNYQENKTEHKSNKNVYNILDDNSNVCTWYVSGITKCVERHC